MRNVEALPQYSNVELLEKPKPIMPLAEKIPPAKDRLKASTEELNTAGHEFNHLLVALSLGIPILSVSIIPNDYSLGRTTFAGHIPTEKMQVIAAAGKVATHDGSSCGHGSDMSTVRFLAHFHNGMPEESAVKTAQSIISKYSMPFRQRAAEILTHMEQIDEKELSLFLTRVQMELDLEGIADEEIEMPKPIKPQAEKFDGKTIIEHLPNGDYRVIYVIGNKIEIEQLICNLCLDVNGHSQSCPRYKQQENVIFSFN